jgi:hypothetical protein
MNERQFFAHEALLDTYHNFFAAYNHSSSPAAFQDLANKYATRLWDHGIFPFLEMLKDMLPKTLDHMRRFLHISYAMVAVLMETVLPFESTWIEYLNRLAGYRTDLEKDNSGDWKVWCDRQDLWQERASVEPDSPL